MLLNVVLNEAKNFKSLNHLLIYSFLEQKAQKCYGESFIAFLDSNSDFFNSETDLSIFNLKSRLIKRILIDLKSENLLTFQFVKKSAILIKILHFKQELSDIKFNLSEKNTQNSTFKQELSTISNTFDTFKQELSNIKRDLSEFKSFLSEKCEKLKNFPPPVTPPSNYIIHDSCSGVLNDSESLNRFKLDSDSSVNEIQDREKEIQVKNEIQVKRVKDESLLNLSESRECACERETLKNEAEQKKEVKKPKKPRGASFDINSLELPSWLDLDLWQDYIAHRAEKRAKLTASGAKRMLLEWCDWQKSGINVNNCIKNALVKGWLGVFKENANNQTLGGFKSENKNEQKSENEIDNRKPSERCALLFDSPEEEAAAWEKARKWGREQSEKMRKEREERDREIWGDIPEHWRFGS